MSNPIYQRAQLLFQQRRYDLAADACREALAQSPQDAFAHALLGLCFLQQKKYEEATAEAQLAIHQAPDSGYCHYVSGVIFQERNRFPEAEAAAREALNWNPEDPDYWSLLAQVCIAQQRWQEALDAADRGLQFEPEHTVCINLRAMALVKLGNKQAAAQSIAGALERNPHSAFSHANQGWTLLHQNRHKEAMDHFAEALRIDPNNEWAQQGMIAALKARHFLYRCMLRYHLWMSRFGRRGQWVIIVGFWLAAQMLRVVKESRPDLAVFVYPLLVAYGLFVVSSWLADPILNFTLLLNRYGRYLLSATQRTGAVVVAGLLVSGVALGVVGLVLSLDLLIIAGLLLAVFSLPAAATFRNKPGKKLALMLAYTGAVVVAGVLAVALMAANREEEVTFFQIALWGSVLSSFASNILGGLVEKK